MATAWQRVQSALTTDFTTVYTVPALTSTVVLGIRYTNIDGVNSVTVEGRTGVPTEALGAFVLEDDTVETDDTADANNATANDVLLFPATEVATEDRHYIGSANPFSMINYNIGTPGAGGTPTVTYKYWNGTTWTAVTGLVDGTNGTIPFDQSGEVRFNIPSDWTSVAMDGAQSGLGSFYWIQVELATNSYTTTNPLATQIWTENTVAFNAPGSPVPSGSSFVGLEPGEKLILEAGEIFEAKASANEDVAITMSILEIS